MRVVFWVLFCMLIGILCVSGFILRANYISIPFPSPTVRPTPSYSEPPIEIATVAAVIDGDTIQLTDKRKVRYIGIDTPETKHPVKKVECFGVEASLKNKELVSEKTITMQKDISEKDRYGRLLRYVWIGDIFVNDYLVRQGFALQSTFPPDVRYTVQFKQAAEEARTNNRGLWDRCK